MLTRDHTVLPAIHIVAPIVAAGCVDIVSVHFHYFFGYITRINLIFVLTCLPTYGEAYLSSGLWFYAAVC